MPLICPACGVKYGVPENQVDKDWLRCPSCGTFVALALDYSVTETSTPAQPVGRRTAERVNVWSVLTRSIKPRWFIFWAAVILVGFCLLSNVFKPNASDNAGNWSDHSSAVPEIGRMGRILSDHEFGFTDSGYYQKIAEYARQGDTVAVKKALAAGILARTCRIFHRGETVYVVDMAFFSGLVKVRREGDVSEYWVSQGAVGTRN